MNKLLALVGSILTFTVIAQPLTVEFSNSPSRAVEQHVFFVNDAQTKQLPAKLADLNEQSNERLKKLINHHEFTGNKGATLHLEMVGDVEELLLVGIESEANLTPVDWHNLGGKIAAALQSTTRNLNVSVYTANLPPNSAAHLAMGYQLRHYHFDKYKSDKQDSISRLTKETHNIPANKQLFENDLTHVAKGTHFARDLAWEPGKAIYPQSFVDEVKALFNGVDNVSIDVLSLAEMQRLTMGALLGVGKGSVHEPKLLVVEYRGGIKGGAPIVLAGKGITFDTGGTSIKPNNGMWAMKSDMSGAAAVAGAVYASAMRGEKVNLVGVMPLAENMPGPDAIRPGDVLETMKGTTIEIISTDAEGRLILADAVYYAQQRFQPKMLLNIATLTGSAARALSDEYAALVTRDFAFSTEIMAVGEASGEHVWPLPLHPNHFDQLKSDIADIKNSGVGNPGASIGAAVVGTFVDEDLPWVHLDIAGVDWLDSATDTAPKGAHGWGVRFMDQLVRQYK
jgi:leucyl aminopeptidase